mmetsp:Transcript_17047/g.53754  ORF Transcript_17047/g.53754 Transcript_17047/m.53754 type:complete len:276 (+) Transcript_17047:136-963(+)
MLQVCTLRSCWRSFDLSAESDSSSMSSKLACGNACSASPRQRRLRKSLFGPACLCHMKTPAAATAVTKARTDRVQRRSQWSCGATTGSSSGKSAVMSSMASGGSGHPASHPNARPRSAACSMATLALDARTTASFAKPMCRRKPVSSIAMRTVPTVPSSMSDLDSKGAVSSCCCTRSRTLDQGTASSTLAPSWVSVLKLLRKPHSGVPVASPRQAGLLRHESSILSLARKASMLSLHSRWLEPGRPFKRVTYPPNLLVRHACPRPARRHAAPVAW